MQPIPDLASVPTLDPSIAQSRKNPTPDRSVGPGEPHARLAGTTEASHGGGGSGAGMGGGAGVDRGEADLPRAENPPGRPPLARCCGARTRSGPGCRGLAMENGRCRMHGGGSTGPRTREGFAKLAAARTRHGRYGAAQRALRRHHRTLVERNRLWAEAEALWPYLSPDLRARLDLGPAELGAPVHPSRVAGAPVVEDVVREAGLRVVVPVVGRDARGRFSAGPRVAVPARVLRGRVLRGRAAERVIAQAEAAALAPWKAGIAQALKARGMVLAGRRAVRDAVVRNDPIGGSAVGGGGSAPGAGAQRPYTRLDGGDDGVVAPAARWAVRDAEVRNDPIGGSATGGGGVASGAGAQRPYTRPESGGAGDDGAMRAGDGAGRVGKTRDDLVAGSTMGGEFAISAGASRPHARADGAGDDGAVRAARRAAEIADTRNDPIPGNATDGGIEIGAVASRPHARPGGAGDDSAVGAGSGAAWGAGMAARGKRGLGSCGRWWLVCPGLGAGRMRLPARRPRNVVRCGRRRVGCGLGCSAPAASMVGRPRSGCVGGCRR